MGKYKVFGCDTDSIIFCKPDGSPIDEAEQESILDAVNALYPSRIRFEDDGYYPRVIVFKAKNYVLFDGKKIKTKGSALKDAKKELALKEFQSALISSVIEGREDYQALYHKYVREILDLKDISRWSSKKTISKTVMESPRTNESKVRDAIAGSEYVEGDKCYLFFKSDGTLCLQENFTGDYHKDKMLEKLWKSTQLFKDVLPKDLFVKFFQKRQKHLLDALTQKA